MTRKFTPQEKSIWNLLENDSKRHIGCIRFGKGEAKLHRELKINKCNQLFDVGHLFCCEAEFEDGSGRTDILDLTKGEAVEIVVSEPSSSIAEKRKKYPVPIKVVSMEVVVRK